MPMGANMITITAVAEGKEMREGKIGRRGRVERDGEVPMRMSGCQSLNVEIEASLLEGSSGIDVKRIAWRFLGDAHMNIALCLRQSTKLGALMTGSTTLTFVHNYQRQRGRSLPMKTPAEKTYCG